jgi:CRP/FNR family cyclic AMP-dependent transcriptional regulator
MEPTSQRLDTLLGLLSQRDEIQRALLDLPLPAERLDKVAALFECRDFAEGELIVEESSSDIDTVMFIVQGKADAMVRPTTVDGRPGEPQVVGHSEALDVIGEIGLVMRTPRSATVQATAPVELLAIGRDALAELMSIEPALANALVRWCAQNAAEKIGRTLWMHDQAYPIGVEVKAEQDIQAAHMLAPDFALADIERKVSSKSARTIKNIKERLQELRCFEWEKDEVTDEVAKLFDLVKVPSKRGILAEGELGESLFILTRGIANIRKRDGELVHGWVANHHRPVHTLLGEMAFLNPGARTGTVLAATSCELLELQIEAVPKLVACAPRLAQHLHLGLIRAVCPKLVETSTVRATVEAVSKGDWEQWFVDDDYYTKKLKALDLK